MSLAEGAMAPSPAMMTGLPKPPQSAIQPPQQRRSRALLQLEQLSQWAAAPSSQLVEQIPAASPAPFFASSPAGGAVSLEELQRQDAASKSAIAASVYDGEKEKREEEELLTRFFVFFANFSLSLSHPLSFPRQNQPFRPPIHPAAISKNSQYSDLKQLIDKTGLSSALGPDFSGTVFVPVR